MKNKITKLQIGVMGGAFEYSDKAIIASYRIGKEIAKKDCVLITGATTGIPYAAVVGANENNGLSIGVSPASNAKEHIEKYKKPLDGYDTIIYTGMGFNGREPILTSSCDGLIYIGGEFGTLIEFGQGFYSGKVLGVLTGVGGISDNIENILKNIKSSFGSSIIFDTEPERLVQRIIKEIENKEESLKHIVEKNNKLGNKERAIINYEK